MMSEKLPRVNAYRRRIYTALRDLLVPRGPFGAALDFGSGDGWFASQVLSDGVASEVVPLDVQPRKRAFLQPALYRGAAIPFADQSFDLCYSIDVLHHCEDPVGTLLEVLRCTRRYVVIKDHTFQSRAQWLLLCMLDEIGNRRFGVRSVYRYQRGWQWMAAIEAAGFVMDGLIYPARCHGRPLCWVTDAVQFIAIWRRT